ncbi:MAG: hypothetical protein ACHQNT_01990 [Bacteroidia bacterium]
MKFILPLGFMALMIACSPSTKLERTWTDPSVTPETVKSLKKVLIIARLKDETTNRTAEDKIVSRYKSGQAVQSYVYLQASDTNQTAVDNKLRKDGFDGIIVMRLTGIDKSLDIQNTGYSGYYRWGYGTTTVSENQTFNVETKLYSMETGKMLWSGTTSTYNPSSLDKSMDDIIAAIKAQFVKQGLITE